MTHRSPALLPSPAAAGPAGWGYSRQITRATPSTPAPPMIRPLQRRDWLPPAPPPHDPPTACGRWRRGHAQSLRGAAGQPPDGGGHPIPPHPIPPRPHPPNPPRSNMQTRCSVRAIRTRRRLTAATTAGHYTGGAPRAKPRTRRVRAVTSHPRRPRGHQAACAATRPLPPWPALRVHP